ncbi:MAG: hypothetical protein EA351_03380 [Gemmatimonadales bacterium]|nr:MAG: hypothetical protein EA351_03380 [Gemmatimonadales bacterium]
MTTHMKRLKRAGVPGLALAFLILFAVPGLHAQVPAAPQSGPIALVGGTLHTVTDGVIENGTLVFEDGRITAMGTDVSIPSGAEQIDIAGLHVYPGLINGNSHVGLFEIGGWDVTIDTNEYGDINPNMRAQVAVHPESRHIGTTRNSGALVTLATPSGGRISGLAAALNLDGWTFEQMTLRGEVALMVNWPGGGGNQYRNGVQEIREAFARARAYKTAADAADAGQGPALNFDARWEAMRPVFDGEIPVIVSESQPERIRDAVEWAEEEGVRMILMGGGDADLIADFLVENDIPVLLTSVQTSPNRDWAPYDDRYNLPARLADAGVRFGIVGGTSAAYSNRLPWEAGVTMAFGLSPDQALRSVTIDVAEILGIADRVGSLAEGKDATLLITTGHPLEYTSAIERAFIEGRDIDLVDAHREFYDRYSEKLRQLEGGN